MAGLDIFADGARMSSGHGIDDNTSYVDAAENSQHCDQGALTGRLGLLVQALLALIAFGALVVKRFCEPRLLRRSWKIWFFDTSKQAIGAAVIHFANVFLSELFQGDPCTWYIISFLLDSTIGLLIICVCLKLSLIIVKRKGYTWLIFGHYGNPPKCNAWLGQCAIYIAVVLFEKILMTLLILFDFWKKVRDFVLSPIRNATVELVLVMFVIPLIVNALIFWVVDNYLKERQTDALVMQSEKSRETSGSSHTVDSGTSSRHTSFSRAGYSKVVSTCDSDTERLISVDDNPGFNVVVNKNTRTISDHALLEKRDVQGRPKYDRV